MAIKDVTPFIYQKVDQLSDDDQKALIIVLDSLVARSNMQQIASQSEKLRR